MTTTSTTLPPCTYVVPFRRTSASEATLDALAADFRRVGSRCEVIVVDGSPPADFARHATAWRGLCRHVPPDPRWRFRNGKVNGVMTGVAMASSENVVLADDDVVYELSDIERMCELLRDSDLVVPQNYFRPLPWWARLESGRILLNRACRRAGDYPGTHGVRRSTFERIGPYDGNVLFENDEMRRHFCRHGARVHHARDFWIARRPPSFDKWREQRLRQAYEDLDFPLKTAAFAALLPLLALAGVVGGIAGVARYAMLLLIAGGLLAARGRRDGAAAVIPATTCLWAPLWVLERMITVYAAAWLKLNQGGYVYGGRRIAHGISRAHSG